MGNILSIVQNYISPSNKIRDALPNLHNQKATPRQESDDDDSEAEYESCNEEEPYVTVNTTTGNNTYKSFDSIMPQTSNTNIKLKYTYGNHSTRYSGSQYYILDHETLAEPSVLEDFTGTNSSYDSDTENQDDEAMVTCQQKISSKEKSLDNSTGSSSRSDKENLNYLDNGDNNNNTNNYLAWEIDISNDLKRKKSPPKHLQEILKKRKTMKK